MAGQCATLLFSSQKKSLQLFDKNDFKCFGLLCPPTREPRPKHIWDMVALSMSAHSVPLCQRKQKCKGGKKLRFGKVERYERSYLSTFPKRSFLPPLHFCLMASKIFFLRTLLERCVLLERVKKGGRFGFGDRNEVILVV